MNVRSKMYVEKIVHSLGGYDEVHFRPVTTGTEEDKAFYRATPSGQLVLGGVRPEIAHAYEIGQKVYVTVEPAEE